MKKVLGIIGVDGSTLMWTYLMPPNFTLKNGSNGKFYVLYHNFF